MNQCKYNSSGNLEDLQIIAEVKSGNKNSYEKLIKKYQKKLFNIALRITLNTDDALEVTQETFLKSYYNINQFDINRTYSSWLYKITHNTACEFIKKKKQSINIDKLENVIQHKEELDRKIYVDSLLKKLSLDQRLIIELRHYQELTYEQIAEILNITVSSVKSKLFRARKQLQTQIRSK